MMFFKATKSQTSFLLRQKGTVFVFYVLLVMVLRNFIENVLTFQGSDVSQMYHPMKILLLSYNRVYYNASATLLLLQLYPLLVVCPAGFSLAKEYQSGQNALMIARLGNLTYKSSKLLAGFLATAIVFSVPFLIEIVLNCLSFPLTATGDLYNQSIYHPDYIQRVRKYFMSGFYVRLPYLYTIAGTLLFGVASGILGAFTVAFSSMVQVKYRVFLFLPVFLLLNVTVFIAGMLPKNFPSMIWYDHLLLFNDKTKSLVFWNIGLFLLVLFSLVFTFWSGRREYWR
jgi:hypothetical protein